jgi:hypothetical protein
MTKADKSSQMRMKMRKNSLSFLLTFTVGAYAFEELSLPNLSAPTVIKPFAIEAQIQHQFWGRVDGNDMFSRLFGIGDGADISIGVSSNILRQTQVFLFYDKMQLIGASHNEFSSGISYAFFLSKLHLRMQAEGEIFSYASFLTDPETRKTGAFIKGCFQNDPLLNRITGLCNVGYNFESRKPGLGIGLDFAVTRSFDAFCEYFPILGQTDASLSPNQVYNPFSFGVKLTTFGHQFFIYIGNTLEIGTHNLMRGTSDNNLRLGFMIKRLFDYSSSR